MLSQCFLPAVNSLCWVTHVHELNNQIVPRWESYTSSPNDPAWFNFVGGFGLGNMTNEVALLYALKCANTDFEQGLAYGRWINQVNTHSQKEAAPHSPRSDRHFLLINEAIDISETHYDELALNEPQFLKNDVLFSGSQTDLSRLAEGVINAPTDFICGVISSGFLISLSEKKDIELTQFTINAIERFSSNG